MAMIELKNVALSYGSHRVLENFSAHISQNSITAIIGRNGSGKSTLLSAISGDIDISDGEILLHGHAIRDLSSQELAYLRSYATQSHTYWMAYPVEEILRMGHDAVSQERYEYLVDALDIRAILKQRITTLSGGQLQRVEIARAFMRDTTLVLLDEPFASQDIESTSRLIALMKSEKTRGVTIILVAHEKREDLSWCDAVIEIEG
jgi:ABC-type cobalamin/Fe3+-siderophores transport system ATPase subunit